MSAVQPHQVAQPGDEVLAADMLGEEDERSNSGAIPSETAAILKAMALSFDADYFHARHPDFCDAAAATDPASIFDAYLTHVRSHACDPSRSFSEHWYLAYNPDAKHAVIEGEYRCGFEHWIRFGQHECRMSTPPQSGLGGYVIPPTDLSRIREHFDPQYAREQYGDVLQLPADMDESEVFESYLANVQKNDLDPNKKFSESHYLERNPDVKASIKAGTYHCGFHHWVVCGRQEGRAHRPPGTESGVAARLVDLDQSMRRAFANLFDREFYASSYPAANDQKLGDVFEDFMQSGLKQGRIPVPREQFDEEFYVSYYHDVDAAKRRGDIPSGYYHFIVAGRSEGRSPTHDIGFLLKAKLGDAAQPIGLSRVHDIADRLLPIRVQIDNTRVPTLNVFAPTLDADMMFGGYIAFFHCICRLVEGGYRIRFVILEDFYCNRDWFLRNLTNRPRWLSAFRDAEFVNCTRKSIAVSFNSSDTCIAYSTWTMHDASTVAHQLREPRAIFFIQEYEPIFHENDAVQFVCAAVYRLPHFAIFNSELLKEHFRKNRIGVFARKSAKDFLTFRHALGATSPDFTARAAEGKQRRLLCYARPEKHAGRNLFEICILALRAALRQGVFEGDWSFHGIGSLGHDYEIDLGLGQNMAIVSRVAQDQYQMLLRSFDVGLSLMWAPHPSVIPFELARSGVVTVTNVYGNRTKRELAKFGFNIVGADPTIDGITAALRTAVGRSVDIPSRLQGATFEWPTNWDEVFDAGFIAEVERQFSAASVCKGQCMAHVEGMQPEKSL